MDFVELDCEGKSAKLDIERLIIDTVTPPFISPRRLILVRRSGAFKSGGLNEQRSARMVKLLEGLPDSTCLLFLEDDVDKRQKKLVKLVETNGVLAQILHERIDVLTRWVIHELEGDGVRIGGELAENLVDRCEADMLRIDQEVRKLRLCCSGEGISQVDRGLVDALCVPDDRGTIFDITDAISQGQTEKALRLLRILIDQKQPPQLILFLLARHFKQLMLALEAGGPDRLMSAAGVGYYIAVRLLKQSRRFSWPKLIALYSACFHTDYSIKSGQIQDVEALEILLAQAGRAALMR